MFGNLADNAFDPKGFLVICGAIVGLYFIALGLFIDYSELHIQQKVIDIEYAQDSVMLLYAGIKAFSMVQLFNWFPGHTRGVVMAVFTAAE